MDTSQIEQPPTISTRRFPGDNPFKLGLFSFNTFGGLTNTLAPERWQATWANMKQLAIEAEAAGLEFLLPLAGWMGHHGDAETDGHFHETLSWAAGLLEATQRIHIFATIHVPFVHPVFAAKQIVTCDHIGEGRIGLNLLAGYNEAEFDMFGIDFGDHDGRYEFLAEWLTVVRRLWQETQPFDFKGEHFELKQAISVPKPIGDSHPMIVSAGSSPTGRSFALNNADALFMVVTDLDQLPGEIEAIRNSMGSRRINIYCSGHIICRPTQNETEAYYDYLIQEHGDWKAGEFMRKAYEEIKSVPIEVLQSPAFMARLMSGHGTFPIVGDPTTVVETIAKLHSAGIDGLAFAMPNYLEDFKVIKQHVLPKLVEAGLRKN